MASGSWFWIYDLSALDSEALSFPERYCSTDVEGLRSYSQALAHHCCCRSITIFMRECSLDQPIAIVGNTVLLLAMLGVSTTVLKIDTTLTLHSSPFASHATQAGATLGETPRIGYVAPAPALQPPGCCARCCRPSPRGDEATRRGRRFKKRVQCT